MKFQPADTPFPRWMGPYSPARGNHCGFRMNAGRLGVYVNNADGREFWTIQPSPGLALLERTIRQHFTGGRVLLLPDGSVVKPLQTDEERGRRVFLGEFFGDIVLQTPAGELISMENPGALIPGARWPGPSTTGLECVIDSGGNVRCDWRHPAEYGDDTERHVMIAGDSALLKGFRAARPGDSAGRVRVTARGHVITNRQVNGEWICLYVGRIDTASWPYLDTWIDWEE